MGDSSSGPQWPPPDDATWQGFTPHESDPYGDPYGPDEPAAAGPKTGALPAFGDPASLARPGPGDAGGGPGGDGGDGPPGGGGGEGDGEGGEPARRFGLTRRQALVALGATGVVGAGILVGGRRLFTDDTSATGAQRPPRTTTTPPTTGATTTAPPPTEPPPEGAPWSDPATWGGAVPGEGDVAEVSTNVILDVDTKVAGVNIHPGARLAWDPGTAHTLQSTGNVVVHGTLQMRPANPGVQQVLTFAGVDEEAYTGGHTMEPLAEDVGLWVTHDGIADIAGAAKTPWTRLMGGADAGATSITVEEAEGWQVGDEIVVAPSEPATVDEHWEHNDRTTITAVSGTTITLADALAHPHPAVTVREGVTHTAEVLNLSRNVRLEGTEDGRAHVMFVHLTKPQNLSHLAIRHMGPRQGGPDDAEEGRSVGVPGRYGLHFHMCEDATRGSKITGVAVSDTGGHAFVPHLSHGMTFEQCVSHETRDDAFWWDPAPEEDDPDTIPTHGVVYDRCVASTVREGEDVHATAAFFMGSGDGNVARGCVAFGAMGHSESASAFHWPERSRGEDELWVFEDCLAHNNKQSGIYYWQNEVPRTIVDRFTAYQNGWGIWAGAYANPVSYRDCTLYQNLEGGLEVSAASAGEGATYEGMYVDQGGLSDFACVFHGPIAGGDVVTKVSGCTFKGGEKAQVTIQTGPGPDSDSGELTGQNYEFTDCTFEGNAFWLEEGVRDNAHIRVSDGQNGTLMLHKVGSGGSAKPEWNATTTPA